jgi:hypothetical protein
MNMQLVPQGPSHVELWAVAVADNLIKAGQMIHRRFAVVPEDVAADELFVRLERWRMGTERFIFWGAPLAFSQRKMAEAGIARRKAHDKYMKLLRDAGLLIVYPQSGAYWAYPWNKRAALISIRRRLIALPYPIAEDAPALFTGPVADAQLAQHTQLTQVSAVWARSGGRPPELKGK